MPSHLTLLLLTIVVLAVIIPNTAAGGGAYAFGAGNIPNFAYLEGKAFRHGDIEDVLAELLRKAGGGGLLSFGSSKFTSLDVKRVYFGNWLRDYSQAVDIGSLKQVQLQTILNIVMVLGYATGSFEVTAERLGTYLPVEHIDNPKGYGEGEDPRKYHPKLRGPVHPEEYAVDHRSGMKNYIANENGHWDTSKAHVRRLIEACIHYGRQYRKTKEPADKFESYRLLGSAMHTLEDFFAHSNFCELSLISIGKWNVFPHVGERTQIRAANGTMVYPLVTGTFGGSDFIHSLLGEATDHLSQSSVSSLATKLDDAQKKKNSGGNADSLAAIKQLTGLIPGFGSSGGAEMNRDIEDMERARAGTQGKKPSEMSPQEVRNAIWPVLVFRDKLVMAIEKVVERIPGLQSLLANIMDAITVFVLTTLDPILRPLISTATHQLTAGSGAVINNHDQYEVFDDPTSSDPTHSFLSKDHFGMILNEPAGNLAKIVVLYSVPQITAAWDSPKTNVRDVTENILHCLFHPDWHDRNSKIQVEILTYMGKWMHSHGNLEAEVMRRLSKECVRRHENVRFQGEIQGVLSVGVVPGNQNNPTANVLGRIPGVSDVADKFAAIGISTPLASGGGRQETRREAEGIYPPESPGQYGNAGPPPRREGTFPDSGRYGAPPPAGGPPGTPYAPPPGPPPSSGGVASNAPSMPTAGGGYGFPEVGAQAHHGQRHDHHHKPPHHRHGNWDDQDYRPGEDSDNSSVSTAGTGGGRHKHNKHHPRHHGGSPQVLPAAFPSANVPGAAAGPPPTQYYSPPGPPPGGSSYYAPPAGPPPTSSAYGGMPSPSPGFPSAGGYGGYGAGGPPGFPSAGGRENSMPSAFPSYGGNSNPGGYGAPGGGYGAPPQGVQCPSCTFMNSALLTECEMCQTGLPSTAGGGGGGAAAAGGYPGAGSRHAAW